jgi:hypothetical protein
MAEGQKPPYKDAIAAYGAMVGIQTHKLPIAVVCKSTMAATGRHLTTLIKMPTDASYDPTLIGQTSTE